MIPCDLPAWMRWPVRRLRDAVDSGLADRGDAAILLQILASVEFDGIPGPQVGWRDGACAWWTYDLGDRIELNVVGGWAWVTSTAFAGDLDRFARGGVINRLRYFLDRAYRDGLDVDDSSEPPA